MPLHCTIHLDFENQANKPNELKVKQITNRITQDTVEVNPEQLAMLISAPYSRTWMPGIINGRRKNENWVRQEVFAVDIDQGLSLDSALKRLHGFQLDCTFAYSTFSSSPENTKYRMVFFIENEISTIEEYETVKQSFMYLFPEMDRHCTAPSSMFHGGREVIYSRFEYVLDIESLKVAGDLHYIGSATSERNLHQRNQKVAKKRNPINNIIDLRKTAEISLIRNFDMELALHHCEVLNDFANRKWMHHPQLFGLATNLLYIEGGLKWMKKKMDECGKYSTDKYAILPYVKSQRYNPQRLEHFSPYEKDHKYKNILQAGKLAPGENIRHSPYAAKKLSEMEAELFGLISRILDSKDKAIHIVKVPTGVGKTESILHVQNVIIACTSHDQKKELMGKFKVPFKVTPEPPKFSSQPLNEKVEALFKAGGAKLVMDLFRKMVPLQVGYRKDYGEDGEKAQNFLDELEDALRTDSTVITTHHRSVQDFKHETIIFDEDPLKTILMPIEEIKVSDLITLKRHILDPMDRDLVEDWISDLGKAKPNICHAIKKFSFNNYYGVEEAVLSTTSITSPVMNFFNGGTYVVDEYDNNIIHFSRTQYMSEDKKVIILSATANEWIYRQLYGDRVKFHDLGNVQIVGKLLQDTKYTYSRQNLCKDIVMKHVLENVEDRLVITFADFVGKFKNAQRDIYYGKCTGTNKLEGEKLAVVGTPHIQMSTYLLLANKLGLDLLPVDYRMSNQRIVHNNLEFKFFTFENQFLRNIQFFYIESELRQAVGRARLVRQKDSDVLLFSNFPLEEANFMFEVTELEDDNKTDDEEKIAEVNRQVA